MLWTTPPSGHLRASQEEETSGGDSCRSLALAAVVASLHCHMADATLPPAKSPQSQEELTACSLEALERAGAGPHLDLDLDPDFWPPQLWKDRFLASEATVCGPLPPSDHMSPRWAHSGPGPRPLR